MLDLSSNEFSAEGVGVIADATRNAAGLRQLRLLGNKIPFGLDTLCQLMQVGVRVGVCACWVRQTVPAHAGGCGCEWVGGRGLCEHTMCVGMCACSCCEVGDRGVAFACALMTDTKPGPTRLVGPDIKRTDSFLACLAHTFCRVLCCGVPRLRLPTLPATWCWLRTLLRCWMR